MLWNLDFKLSGSKFKHNGSRQAHMHGQLHTLVVVDAECIVEAGNVIEGPMMIMVFVTSNIDLMVPAFDTTGD
uniref:Uncharacterized protein n=1 Tax=Oryza rufipogon TaxID=4529 RepID=A0A0E0RGL2_ORYRU